MDAIEKILIRLFLIIAVGRASAQTFSNYSQVDVPGVAFAYVTGINNNNQLLGWTWPPPQRLSIVRNPDGMTWTTIHVPGTFDGVVYAYGINNLGQIVGNYPDSSGGHGYVRSADGQTITTFDQPFATTVGTKPTYPAGINDKGETVGTNGNGRGFRRGADGSTYTAIEVPGAYATSGTTGYFSVSNNDLGSSDCRTMLPNVPRRRGSWIGTGTVIVVVSERFCMI